MIKTKIGVEIHSTGTEAEYLLKVVGNVNEKGIVITPEAICGYLMVRNAIEPTYRTLSFKVENDHTLHISEDGGKTFTLTLTWKEVEELEETKDDVPKELFEVPNQFSKPLSTF